MVIIENNIVNNIPLLHVVQSERKHEQLPLIIFMHGFTSAKENNLHYSYLLAEKGFRVVLPEARHHGARAEGLTEEQLMNQFWEIVIQSIHELPIIKQYVEETNHIDRERIGVVGTSMGGITTLGALTQYDWIKAAVSLMGVPSYQSLARRQLDDLKKQNVKLDISDREVETILHKLAPYDLSLHPEKLGGRPLLFWHGKQDPVVPYAYAYEFYEKMNTLRPHGNHLQFITDEHAAHKVSQAGVASTVKWFEKYLAHK